MDVVTITSNLQSIGKWLSAQLRLMLSKLFILLGAQMTQNEQLDIGRVVSELQT
jgi:hypothetical protein